MDSTPATAAARTTKVELAFACRNLPCMDVVSKSDHMVVTYVKPFAENQWKQIHRTAAIQNNHDPVFMKKLNIPYHFQEQQLLKFEVYNVNSRSWKLSDHDFIGSATCSLASIISSGKVQLLLGENFGGSENEPACLIITAEELQDLNNEISLEFHGVGLDKKNYLWWKSDPFLVFSKPREFGDYVAVHRTEVQKNTLNPMWKRFCLSVRDLCDGNYDMNLRVTCFSHHSSGEHSLIGEFYTTLRQLQTGPGTDNVYHLINDAKKGKRHSGEIHLKHSATQKIPTFMDYLKGGTQLHCAIAIDFTESNGNPALPDSLHYMGPQANAYELAIIAVGMIIEDYNNKKMFPVFGFGAKLPPYGEVSHEFFVNLHPANPYVHGINGVLMAYQNCLKLVQLHEPTNFAPIIDHVAKLAETYRDGSGYLILLILTDCVVTDRPETIQAIVSASFLPMSIIIVGIGAADFSAMETLDEDAVALQPGGKHAQRVMVQFFRFPNFVFHRDEGTAGLYLARKALAEVPSEFLSYMRLYNISPRPPQDTTLVLPPDPGQMRGAQLFPFHAPLF